MSAPGQPRPTAPADEAWNGGDALVARAGSIPVGPAVPFSSTGPVRVPAPGRVVDLHLRVSAPTRGGGLPVVLVSHGGGTGNYLSSLRGLGPLVDFWAAHGFAVIQPTHLSAKSLGLPRLAPDSEAFWSSRVENLRNVLDNLDVVERSVPGLAGRLDHDRVAVAGHSMGAQTAAMLLGSHFVDDDGTVRHVPDARAKAGILLSSTGAGGDHLTDVAARFTCLRTAGFDRMTKPALVVVGGRDESPELSSRGPAYHADPYTDGPGPKSLLTLFGGEHQLGGVTGYDAEETTDEDPERVGAVQRLTWAYLRSAVDPGASAWDDARAAFAVLDDVGRLESK